MLIERVFWSGVFVGGAVCSVIWVSVTLVIHWMG